MLKTTMIYLVSETHIMYYKEVKIFLRSETSLFSQTVITYCNQILKKKKTVSEGHLVGFVGRACDPFPRVMVQAPCGVWRLLKIKRKTITSIIRSDSLSSLIYMEAFLIVLLMPFH